MSRRNKLEGCPWAYYHKKVLCFLGYAVLYLERGEFSVTSIINFSRQSIKIIWLGVVKMIMMIL